jgi:ATP-binding cassette subfamily F protein 3
LEKISPLAGEVELGASLKVGYFAQAHEDLHPERTLVQEIDSVAPEMLVADIRDYLARFLFTGEDVFKPVAVLSGGERGRLAFAKLALSGANLLLLDEPTNHLDIPSQEILQEVLDKFQGTILLVSHDRYLIDALATQIWEIDEEKEVLHTFKGSYSQYHLQQEAVRLAEKELAGNVVLNVKIIKKSATSVEDRKKQKRVVEVEALISQKEIELANLGHRLENPPSESSKVQKLGTEYVRIQNELDKLMEEWGDLHK